MNVWVEAARPKTLIAAITPVMVGTAAAERFEPWRFLAALVVAVAIQVGVNYANDYFDGVKGVDTPARRGPRRAVASGLVAPARMRAGIVVAFGVACVSGLALVAAIGPELIIVGAASIAAALLYSGGPRPYGAEGLGEVFVFVFFGLVATAGAAYVQEERVTLTVLAVAVPVGLLATAILVVNNLRDIDTDAAAGKRTLAVRLGERRTRALFRKLVLGAFAALPLVAAVAESLGPLVAFVTLPQGLRLVRLPEGALAQTARLELLYGVSLAAGLWIS